MEKEDIEIKKPSLLRRIKNLIVPDAESSYVTSAEAYNITTYGSYDKVERIINRERERVNTEIRIQMNSVFGPGMSKFDCYNVVVSFVDDLKPYINDILQPFVDRGFKIIRISDNIEEIKDENVYLINWYKSVKKDNV